MNRRSSKAELARVIAHRGASHDAPENTEAAVRLALDQGCDGVECDVQLSADGVPVVFHDDDLRRLANSDERVADLAAKEILGRTVLGDGRAASVVISLEQWLALLPKGTLAAVELKPQSSPEKDAQLVQAAARVLVDPPGPLAVISFSDPVVRAAREAFPDEVGVGPIRNRPLDPQQLLEIAELARSIVVLKHTIAGDEEVAFLLQRGLEVWSYALDDDATLESLWSRGVRGLISNRPDIAREFRDRTEA